MPSKPRFKVVRNPRSYSIVDLIADGPDDETQVVWTGDEAAEKSPEALRTLHDQAHAKAELLNIEHLAAMAEGA